MKLKGVMISMDWTDERGVGFLVSMLRRCPYLAVLILWGRRESKLSGVDDYWEKQEQFNCFNHTLRRVIIHWKSNYEIEFAKYVLAEAKVLKHLTICRISSQPLEEEVLASLPLVERASRKAKLTIRG